MPCWKDEELSLGSEELNPVTPTKPQRNEGAGLNMSDAENSGKNDEEDADSCEDSWSPEFQQEKKKSKRENM